MKIAKETALKRIRLQFLRSVHMTLVADSVYTFELTAHFELHNSNEHISANVINYPKPQGTTVKTV